jgi:hypothetical protein
MNLYIGCGLTHVPRTLFAEYAAFIHELARVLERAHEVKYALRDSDPQLALREREDRARLCYLWDRQMVEAADAMIADVSFPSTGLGIELQVAELRATPVVLCYGHWGNNRASPVSYEMPDHGRHELQIGAGYVSLMVLGLPSLFEEIQCADAADGVVRVVNALEERAIRVWSAPRRSPLPCPSPTCGTPHRSSASSSRTRFRTRCSSPAPRQQPMLTPAQRCVRCAASQAGGCDEQRGPRDTPPRTTSGHALAFVNNTPDGRDAALEAGAESARRRTTHVRECPIMRRRSGVVLLLSYAAVGGALHVACGGDLGANRDRERDAGAGATGGHHDAGVRDAAGVDARAAGGRAPNNDAAADARAEGGEAGSSDDYTLSTIKPYAVPHGQLGWIDGIAVADVTGDSRSDAIVFGDRGLFVFPQIADGKLGNPVGYSYSLPFGTGQEVAVIDLDRNGALDVVVGHHSGLIVFAADGEGGLRPAKAFPGRPSGSRLRVMDVDRDGIADLLAIGGVNPEFVVWYGDGTGGIRELGRFLPAGEDGPGFTAFTIADLTGDGIEDIAALSANTYPRIHGYAHDGRRFFQADELSLNLPLMSVDSIEAGDLGGDSLNDLFVTEIGGAPGHLWAIRQSRASEFSPAEWLHEYDSEHGGSDGLVVYDLDRDGDDDVLVLHGSWPLSVYLQSRGALQRRLPFPMPFGSATFDNPVAVGDLSGDGCTDVAIADSNHGLLVMYGSNCAQ